MGFVDTGSRGREPYRTATAIRVVAAVGVALPLLLLTACSHATPSRNLSTTVTMAYCGTSSQARPNSISVVCGTNDIFARNLTWSAWGKPTATAIGTAEVDLCAFEDCHSGDYNPFPIVLVASKIVNCPQHRRAYSRLQYVFVGTSPFQGVPANISFKNFIAGPMRPEPPLNQTVGLSC
jgi:hypothetical protein